MTSSRTRLVELLAGLDEPGPLHVGAPVGGDWWSLDDAVDAVEGWFPDVVARAGDHRAGAAYLATWVARVPVLLIGLPAVLAGVAPVATSDRLWVHRHAGGWFDRHAIDPDRLVDGVDDDVATATGAQVASLTAPLVDHVVDVLPVGAPMVWGAVVDSLGTYALLLARALGHDQGAAWRRCDAVVDAVEECVPALRHRPAPLPVIWSGGSTLFTVRGTCCLYHRTCADPDPDGEGYCSTCPLRTEGSRTRLLRAHLENAST